MLPGIYSSKANKTIVDHFARAVQNYFMEVEITALAVLVDSFYHIIIMHDCLFQLYVVLRSILVDSFP